MILNPMTALPPENYRSTPPARGISQHVGYGLALAATTCLVVCSLNVAFIVDTRKNSGIQTKHTRKYSVLAIDASTTSTPFSHTSRFTPTILKPNTPTFTGRRFCSSPHLERTSQHGHGLALVAISSVIQSVELSEAGMRYHTITFIRFI